MAKLKDIFSRRNEQTDPKNEAGILSCVGLENIESNSGNLVGEIETKAESIKSIKSIFKKGDILYGKLRPNLNKVWLADRDGICSTDILVLTPNSGYRAEVYELVLRSDDFNQEVLRGLKGAQLPRVSFEYMSDLEIPSLTSEVQDTLSSQIRHESEILSANKKLTKMMESKIDSILSKI